MECNKNKFTKISSHRNKITHDSYISYGSYMRGCKTLQERMKGSI
ncbi:hypothetical protein [Methanosarcina soligelidi]|nr:hypothetical protein [Methanosarcina soligelidi]